MEKEDLQFKPLTEGLGFHRKVDQIKADRNMSKVASDSLSKTLPVTPAKKPLSPSGDKSVYDSISKLISSLPPTMDFEDQEQVKPVAKKEVAPTHFQPLTGPGFAQKSQMPEPGTPAHPAQIVPKPQPINRTPKKFEVPRNAAVPASIRQTELSASKERVSLGLPIVIIDAMVVAGVAILCLVAILLLTNVNLVSLLSDSRTTLSTRTDIGMLFLFVLHFYLLASRSFFGATLGEWAFELEMGTEAQRKRGLYPYQVLWRGILVTLTGFITIPILSFLVQKDLLHSLTGLKLRASTYSEEI